MDLQFTKDPAVLKWIRFDLYSVADIMLILIGTVLWNIAYFIIIKNAFRNKFVEMPVAAGASNIAWEFVWGFLFTTNMGLLFVWGLRIWFFMDVLIFIALMMYGKKQIKNAILSSAFSWIEPALIISWGFIFWAFIKEGYDTAMGATSAYIITIIMAWVYITNFLNNDAKYFSIHVAWTKGLGNFLMTVFVFNHYSEGMWFLKCMTIIVTILDLIYLIMVAKSKYQSQINKLKS
jgi:hypothetical protein